VIVEASTSASVTSDGGLSMNVMRKSPLWLIVSFQVTVIVSPGS
jgi:hypothetical protein